MRKVTASAVILTAITGCGQNEAPSAQWSFEPPAATEAALFTADALQRQSGSDPMVSSLSPEAQRFLDSTSADGRSGKMGPAFEQPNQPIGSGSLETQSETVLGSNQPAQQTIVGPIQTQRRTDPIAEARAYLSRARSGSFLGDRVPYSAQVDLPSAPNYTTSIYSQQAAAFEPSAAEPITNQASLEQASIAAVPTLNDAAQAVASLSQQPPAFSTSDLLAAATPTPLAVVEPEVEFVSPTPSPQLTSYSIDNLNFEAAASQPATVEPVAAQPIEDALPVLRPAEVRTIEDTSVIADAETENQTAAAGEQATYERDENVSIGTAILNDLRRTQETEKLEIEHVESDAAVATLSSDEPAAEQVVTEQLTAEQTVTEQPAFETRSTPRVSVSAIEPIAISDQISADAKLARLLQTLPQRSFAAQAESSLISHFQSSQEASQQASSHQARMGASVAAEASASSPSLSLLLEGLRETEDDTSALQTLYMPIPETPLASASATLIQTALETLGSNLDTVTLVNELTTASKSATTEMQMPTGKLKEGLESERLVEGEGVVQSEEAQGAHSQQKGSQLKNAEDTETLGSGRVSDGIEPEKSAETLGLNVGNRRSLTRYRQRIVWQ